MSSLPHVLGVDIGVTIKAPTDDELAAKAQKVNEIIKQSALQKHLWHEGFLSLEEVIMQKALAKKLTISFAESCTGGLCSHRLTQISGISQVFWGSVVSYDNSVKEKVLQVKAETIQTLQDNPQSAYSPEYGADMAVEYLNDIITLFSKESRIK